MKTGAKKRIDQLLVDRGLVQSRQKAQALILAGQVLVDKQKAQKPGQAVGIDSSIQLLGILPFVSRGGVKLESALEQFRIEVQGRTCMDIGASTGGFTDCLLQRGAAKVYAVDVGPSQLDWKIRSHPQVVVKDHTNARYLTKENIPEPCSLAVCDVSFISVTMILPALPPLLTPQADMVILVKPQFEAGKAEVGKGGIVKDPALQQMACDKVRSTVEALGFQTQVIDSPILGMEGNREFLLHGSR